MLIVKKSNFTQFFLILHLKFNNMSKKATTYTEAFSEIEEIIEKIENDELDIDDLAEKVKRVSLLIKICKEKLYSTEKEVENILKQMDEK